MLLVINISNTPWKKESNWTSAGTKSQFQYIKPEFGLHNNIKFKMITKIIKKQSPEGVL